MLPLTDEAVAAACLAHYRAVVTGVWGFGWLEETLAVLLRSELEARPRTIVTVDAAVAGDLLRAAVPLLRDADRRARTRRGLVSPRLRDWWACWEALDPGLQEMAFAMPAEWLLTLWSEATARSVERPAGRSTARREVR